MKTIKVNNDYTLLSCNKGSINTETNEITGSDILDKLIFSHDDVIYSCRVPSDEDDREVEIENSDILCEIKNDKCYISGVEVSIDLYNRAISKPELIPSLISRIETLSYSLLFTFLSNDSARTTAVVVPSPASLTVFLAASLIKVAPIF